MLGCSNVYLPRALAARTRRSCNYVGAIQRHDAHGMSHVLILSALLLNIFRMCRTIRLINNNPKLGPEFLPNIPCFGVMYTKGKLPKSLPTRTRTILAHDARPHSKSLPTALGIAPSCCPTLDTPLLPITKKK